MEILVQKEAVDYWAVSSCYLEDHHHSADMEVDFVGIAAGHAASADWEAFQEDQAAFAFEDSYYCADDSFAYVDEVAHC